MGDIADAVQAGVDKGTLTAANNGLTSANAKLQGRFMRGLLLGLVLGAGLTYGLFATHSLPSWRDREPSWRDRERNLYAEPPP